MEDYADDNFIVISRHGIDHKVSPGDIDYFQIFNRLKKEGVDKIIATSAVGSLKEEYKPGQFVVLDDFVDFTKKRPSTFLNTLQHTSIARPYDEELRNLIIKGCRELSLDYHSKGVCVTVEGPRFSTRAESEMFRMLGFDVIGMTASTEAVAANEFGIPISTIAMVTDYDCWRDEEVSHALVIQRMKENRKKVEKLIKWITKNIFAL
jgi:5'-methylthioadenosine phosphorylase